MRIATPTFDRLQNALKKSPGMRNQSDLNP